MYLVKNGSNITDSRPKLVAGSPEGLSGHVDGRLREAKMNHPKGFTVDDRGNIYVADAMNMAIRKISDTGKLKCLLYGVVAHDTVWSPSILCLLFGFHCNSSALVSKGAFETSCQSAWKGHTHSFKCQNDSLSGV